VLITTTTAGFVGSMATGVEGTAAYLGPIGYATNTAVATVAGGLVGCVLTKVA
jgi:lysozyme family protein